MAVAFEFDAIEAGLLHPLGGIGVVSDDAGNVPVFDHFGKSAVRGFARGASADHRKPVAFVPAGAPAKVGQLNHHRRARLVAIIGEAAHPGHDLVLVGEDIVENGGAVF